MKLKLFLIITLGVYVTYAADHVIILQAKDGQIVALEPELMLQSKTLTEFYESGLYYNNNNTYVSSLFSRAQLELLRSLLQFAKQHPVIELPGNPTFDQQAEYQNSIQQIISLFKQQYNEADYSTIYVLADFFDIPSISQLVAELFLTPTINREALEKSPLPLQLKEDVAAQLAKRQNWAKEQYFEESVVDDYLPSISIQDFLNRNLLDDRIVEGESHIFGLGLDELGIDSLQGIENVPGIDQVQNLNLSSNDIKRLPLKIPNLENIKRLDLHNNIIEKFPSKIEGLENLQVLDLRGNSIREIPDTVEGLENLEVLILDGNPVQDIPRRIKGLENLKSLNLSRTQIRNIPTATTGLENVMRIFLNENDIKTIPERITGFPNLILLELSRNNISTVPENIIGLPSLRGLALNENPVEMINPESVKILKNNLGVPLGPLPVELYE